jgi:hypothetical protein
MIEREMGDRGSKSVALSSATVKEQRVDGNRYVNLTYLRYALMGFERNYQIRIPSNQLITAALQPRRSYTYLSPNNLPCNLSDNLNP